MLSKLIDGGRRILDQERLVRTSGLFDEDWYAKAYLNGDGLTDGLSHFLRVGARRGYDPGPRFSMNAYLADYPDVRAAGTNALLHYLRFGANEGRRFRAVEDQPCHIETQDFGEAALARIREAFDPVFYRETNPDLPGDIDPFQHFMQIGWRQRRDPAHWFSVEHYLRTQDDVAVADRNPFAHFLLTGCREGRAVSRSTKVRIPAQEPAPGSARTVAVAMVKNEADIIRAFTQHVLALFDELIIVDHGSEDGTAEFLSALAAANQRVELLRLTEPSYIQSVTMTHVVRDRPQIREADWVFFLDADEFLPFETRAEFQTKLERFASCPVVAMHWQNLIPDTYWQGEAEITPAQEFLVAPKPSPFRKIAFQPSRVALDKLVVAQGNHALLHRRNGLEIPAFEADFPVLHVPVRSVDQLMLKLNQGVLAYQKIGRTRDVGQGVHWYQMKRATEDATLGVEHLNAVADHYSEDKPALSPLSEATMLDLGYNKVSYRLARIDDDTLPDLPPKGLGEMLMRIYAQDFSDAAEEDAPSAVQLVTEGETLVRTDAVAEYDALEPIVSRAHAKPVNEILSILFRPGYKAIEDLVPSDWSGHIPFMFALADLLRPRRYVEIGTLRGASFFAYAQAVREGRFASEAVAVSPWAVEPAKSEEYAGVFEDFTHIARKYADFAGYLRLAPDEALHRFADGSIDLLNMDGFYDYETLSQSIDAWLPKLSTTGVLLLHDIHAHGGEFGVWRVWTELQASYPTLEFRHAQGLGIACVGKDASPDLQELGRSLAEDRALRTLMQEHFERLGAMSAELFSRRFDMARLDMRGAAEAAQIEELTSLKHELATARAEADDLRALVGKEAQRAAG